VDVLTVKVDNNADTLGLIMKKVCVGPNLASDKRFDYIRDVLPLKTVADVNFLENEVCQKMENYDFLVRP